MPFDKIFGTFRDKLKDSGTCYRGGSEEQVDAKTAAVKDTKAALGLPHVDSALYLLLNCVVWALVWQAATLQLPADSWSPHSLAILASVGPLLLAQALANLTDSGQHRSLLYPFHREGLGAASGHMAAALFLCVGPVYVMVHMLLDQPGQGLAYWGRTSGELKQT